MKGESAARLRILLLEDNPADAELVLHELRHAGIEADSVRVITRAEFEARLDPCPEAILSDYQLPLWDGLQALRLVRERGLDVPFIIVSGTIGEDLAVEAMRQGADDYLLKDRLSRLGAALIQALERKRLRQEAHEAAQALLERETGLRRAQIMVRLAHVITGLDGTFESWSESLPKLIGVEPAQMPGSTREWRDLIHPEDRALFHTTCVETGKRGVRTSVEYRIRHKDGAWIHVSQVMEPIDAPAEATGRMRWFNTLLDVTEQKRAAEHLRESESVKGAIIETSLDCVVTIDHEGNVVEFNPAAEATFGIRRDQALGKSMVDMLIPPRLRDAHRRGFAHYLATGEGPILGKRLELEAIRADGTEFPIELAITAIGGTSKPMFAGFIRDITARKEAEAKIVRLNRVYAVLSGINALIVRVKARDELFDGACRIAVEAGRFRMSWIGMVDRKGMKIEPVASAGAKPEYMAFIKNQFSLAEELPMGNTLTAQAVREKKALFSNDTQNDPRVRFNKEHLERGTRSMAILPLLVADEAVGVLVLHTEEADFFDAAELNLLTELAGDISFALDHIEKAEKLDYLAYYDSLTGLANRSLLLERVAQYMRSAVSGGHKLALFLLDLERFKNINDSLGRPAGDALLKQVAEWLTRNVGDPNLLARVGADVFAVVVPEVKREGDVARLLEKTMEAFLEHPFRLNDAVFRIAAQVGVALFPDDGANADTLFKNAEAALKKAKATGDRYLFYTQKMTEMAVGRLTLENQLRQALEKEEFVLHYQSKVDSTTGAILGVEALIRWNSVELGLVPPMNFIPLMEETGLILEVGAWALQKAVQDHAQWQKQGLVPPRIAVNVSQIQMHERDFVSTVVHALKQGAVPPGIDLEITESLVMADIRGNIKKLKQIRNLGVSIAIDDFGTGYSSLAYLAKLPVQTLKIDRSFIITMLDDPDTMTLVSAIISLAHALRLKVVAEGVDAEDQAKVLRRLRCDEMQGYLFRKPLPIEEITPLLSKAN